MVLILRCIRLWHVRDDWGSSAGRDRKSCSAHLGKPFQMEASVLAQMDVSTWAWSSFEINGKECGFK